MNRRSTHETSTPPLSRRTFRLALAVLYLVHLLVVAYAFPARVVFAHLPYAGNDYQTHYHQTYRVAEALRTTGRFWGYEPQFLAGAPTGIIFDVDNKGHFLFSYVLSLLGVHLANAYNLFSAVTSLFAPLCLLLAARLFGVDRRGQLVVVALSTPIFFLDTACRFFVNAGMISYVAAAYLTLLGLALFWRLLQAPGRAGLPFFVGLLVVYPLAHLVHVWAFPILLGPSLILYARAFRRLPWAGHVQVLAVAAAVLAVNAYWLYPSLAHAELMTPSIKLGQGKPFYFLLDIIEIFPFQPPITLQTTMFRYLALAGAAIVVYRWSRARDERAFLALVLFGWFFFISYISAYLPLFRLTEPYRFVLALSLAGVVLAGPFFAELLSVAAWRRQLAGPFRTLAIMAAVLLVPQLGRQVLASAPELIPESQSPQPPDPPPWEQFRMLPVPMTFRQQNVSDDFLAVARYLEKNAHEPGRILAEPWELAEFLGWATDLPVIGGFPERRLVMEEANLFHDEPPGPRFHGQALADYLVRYNIRYLVLHFPNPLLERRGDLLELVTNVGACRVYRTRHRGTYFLRGSGRVSTAFNRIDLSEVTPDPQAGDAAIRFHYMRGLRCRPSCRLEKVPIADSKASFIRIVGEPQLARTITVELRP